MTVDKRIIEAFPWGDVIQVHSVGVYDIVEYRAIMRRDEQPREPRILFHPYINGKDTCRSTDSLDAALAIAIAHRWDGLNEQASTYFCRMIALGEEETPFYSVKS